MTDRRTVRPGETGLIELAASHDDPIAARIARIEAAAPAPESHEIVERVARAMWDAVKDDTPWDCLSEFMQRRGRVAAVAAITALDGAR